MCVEWFGLELGFLYVYIVTRSLNQGNSNQQDCNLANVTQPLPSPSQIDNTDVKIQYFRYIVLCTEC